MDLRIIIVDDHAVLRKGLKQIIWEEFTKAQINEASTAEDAMKIVRQQKFDLVISDISLPGRSGIDLLKQVREEFPFLPFLILSMHPEEQYAIRALKAGASGYITKDTASEELIKGIKKIISGKKYISSMLTDLLADNVSIDTKSLPHESLSDREFEVLKLIARGKSISEISAILSLSINTISTYRSRILEKTKLRNNAELIHYAIDHKLI